VVRKDQKKAVEGRAEKREIIKMTLAALTKERDDEGGEPERKPKAPAAE
jgi:hypothetical protein